MPHLISLTFTSKLRVCSQCSKHMTWKVNFRHDVNTLRSSVCYNLSDLILRIPHAFAIWYTVSRTAITFDACTTTDRTDLCELRVFLDFNSPTLIISKMPMKSIELMNLHYIQISLHLFHAKEMS